MLDDQGWLTGHRLMLPDGTAFALGRVAFLDGPFAGSWIVGETRRGASTVRVLDAAGGCITHSFTQPGLIFNASMDAAGGVLVHDLVEKASGRQLGTWRRSLLDPGRARRILPGVSPDDPLAPVWVNTFAWAPDGSLAAQSCGASQCVTHVIQARGGVRSHRSPEQGVLRALTTRGLLVEEGSCHATHCPTVVVPPDPKEPAPYGAPLVDPRPVPESQSETWSKDALLEFRWGPNAPSDWMRPAIYDAAADVAASRGSRAARFAYDAAGAGLVQLAESMSGNCERALACATRDIPHYWRISLRPQGVRAGSVTTRWCQAYETPPDGCFDLERTMLHEFGHVEGLAHPDDHGFRLDALETVMHPIIPSKSQTGWKLHRFASCDVARLQRRYDTASDTASYALCDRVDTRLAVAPSSSSVAFRERVTITATLRVRDRDGYGRLGGNPVSGRDVTIQRRAPGGSWTSFDASPSDSAGEYALTFQPWTTYEYRAVFDRPSSEGLSGDTSDIVTVRVAPCISECPEAAADAVTGRSH
ncbi:MAG: hypothetical protein M3452_06745 [Chloroflexota bacterium]|nr:hypothetical protein [Chloroflexota bacterium]